MFFTTDSNYAMEASSVAARGARFLAAGGHERDASRTMAERGPKRNPGLPAIVLDVDDTTLATWNYEIFSNWAFNPTSNADFVTREVFRRCRAWWTW